MVILRFYFLVISIVIVTGCYQTSYPLRGEGSVVASFQDDGKIADCWPDTIDAIL